MEPRISMVVLAVADLQHATAFYRDGLGFPLYRSTDSIAFFKMGGTWIELCPRDILAKDAGILLKGRPPRDFALAHNVGSAAEVDRVMAKAKAAGATIVKPARQRDWGGYNGYFADLDGFVWEIVFDPNLGAM
jgi:catechol 2,3-dioxygenase-like lactoylglutathione lyase family enzyme